MPIIISCANNKGGVAKTTTCYNLAYALSLKYKVLMIDLDSQCDLSTYCNKQNKHHTIYNVILNGTVTGIYTIQNNLDLIPASEELALLKDKFNLRKLLSGLEYDYIIIDTPPNFGLLTLNAMASSDHVIVPCLPEYLAYKKLEKIKHTIASLNNKNATVSLLGVLITMHRDTLHHREVSQRIREEYPTFKTVVKNSIKYSDACLAEKSIIEYAPDLGKAYLDLAREVDILCRKEKG